MQRRLERGTTDKEIEQLVESFKRDAGLVFTVDTLEFLARGGRIGRAQAWAGELLSIKPILTIDHGEIVPVKRVRGNRKAFAEFRKTFDEDTEDRPSLKVAIAHADAPDREQALRTWSATFARAPRSRRQGRSAPSSAHTPGRGRSAFFGLTTASER